MIKHLATKMHHRKSFLNFIPIPLFPAQKQHVFLYFRYFSRVQFSTWTKFCFWNFLQTICGPIVEPSLARYGCHWVTMASTTTTGVWWTSISCTWVPEQVSKCQRSKCDLFSAKRVEGNYMLKIKTLRFNFLSMMELNNVYGFVCDVFLALAM